MNDVVAFKNRSLKNSGNRGMRGGLVDNDVESSSSCSYIVECDTDEFASTEDRRRETSRIGSGEARLEYSNSSSGIIIAEGRCLDGSSKFPLGDPRTRGDISCGCSMFV